MSLRQNFATRLAAGILLLSPGVDPQMDVLRETKPALQGELCRPPGDEAADLCRRRAHLQGFPPQKAGDPNMYGLHSRILTLFTHCESHSKQPLQYGPSGWTPLHKPEVHWPCFTPCFTGGLPPSSIPASHPTTNRCPSMSSFRGRLGFEILSALPSARVLCLGEPGDLGRLGCRHVQARLRVPRTEKQVCF